MRMRYLGIFLAASLLASFRPALADDTDLFVRAKGSSLPPDVLFVIDNAANFSSSSTERCQRGMPGDPVTPTKLDRTVGGIEQCALFDVISALDPDIVNIGIMVYNATNVVDFQGVQCSMVVSSRPGGCLVYPMKLMNDANKTTLLKWILSWKTSGSGAGYIKASSEATGGSMQEAWAYYAGRIGLSGTDYALTTPPTTCNKYIVFIGNSFSSSGSPGDQSVDAGPKTPIEGTNSTARKNAFPAATLAQRAMMNPTITTKSCGTATLGNPHDTKGYYMDEWARYMNAYGITTYTIGLIGSGCQADYVALLMNTANPAGGGKYFETKNTDELKAALTATLSEMISKNSVFASVSLPVSVNTEGTYLNQVFIGMFRPDGDALPRWLGNLKQYQLGRPAGSSTGLELQDALKQPAISTTNTGFISNCALSFWTPTTDDNYWANIAQSTCSPHPGASNTPDGDRVEKGAQGYKLRGSPTAISISRNMKTCDGSCGPTLAGFDSGNTAITKAALGNGAMTDADRTNLINWARGLNNNGDEIYVAATAMRPSVHGDVVHSRPAAINYGDDTNPQVVVFYGANDGALRAVNGNQTEPIPAAPATPIAAAGQELWSFMPPEFYGQIQRLRANKVLINFKGIDPEVSPTPLPKPYGFDGPITTDVDPGDATVSRPAHKWVFATMRRGGRMIYAFDVTSLNTNASSPTLKWRAGCPNLDNDTGCVGGYEGMGQTWSTPKVIRTAGYASPMVIVGGGYDRCEDADPATCNGTSKGSRIYVINADTGEKLKEFDLSSANGNRGVAADVFVVPDGSTGRVKWAYAVDLGGNVWRISGADANTQFGATAPGSWTITRIASLGCNSSASNTCVHQRKFMYAPDVVEKTGVYYLLVGSGDREKPLVDYTNAYNTTNYFFNLQDVPTQSNWLTDQCSGNVLCMTKLVDVTTATPDERAAAKGWYLPLTNGSADGTHEQVVTSAITVFGIVTFSTAVPFEPPSGACSLDVGKAYVYNIRYYDAAAKSGNNNRSEEIKGGGLPPSPVAGMVQLTPGAPAVPFLIGGSGKSALEGGEPVGPSSTALPKSLTYWFIHK